MALQFKFEKETMDVIMQVVRSCDVTPSGAVDLLIKNSDVYEEAKNAVKRREKFESKN